MMVIPSGIMPFSMVPLVIDGLASFSWESLRPWWFQVLEKWDIANLSADLERDIASS